MWYTEQRDEKGGRIMDERFSTKAQDLQEQLLALFREGSEEEARAFMDHFNLLMTYYRCAMMEI